MSATFVMPDHNAAIIDLLRGEAEHVEPNAQLAINDLHLLLGANAPDYVDVVFNEEAWGSHNAIWVEHDGGLGGNGNSPVVSQGRSRIKCYSRQFHVALRMAWLCRYALMYPDRSSGGFTAARTVVYGATGVTDPSPAVEPDTGRRHALVIATVLYSEVAV